MLLKSSGGPHPYILKQKTMGTKILQISKINPKPAWKGRQAKKLKYCKTTSYTPQTL
jgi:hypothetical protein